MLKKRRLKHKVKPATVASNYSKVQNLQRKFLDLHYNESKISSL